MLINEVESIVKLSKKSIRYYEEQGLIKPGRNDENKYRSYSEDDVTRLKEIKILRELGVTINDLKDYYNEKLSLNELINDRKKKIDEQKENYAQIEKICENILKSKKIDSNFEEINILNKRGFTMKETNQTHKKKILGALLSSFIAGIFFLSMVILLIVVQFIPDERMPWFAFVIAMSFFGLPLIGIIVNLIERINEIRRGEEDEASKY